MADRRLRPLCDRMALSPGVGVVLSEGEAQVIAFWDMVDSSGGPDACWPWLGRRLSGKWDYGRLRWNKSRYETDAHRIAYEIATGDKLGKRHGCHRCDNPPCCNPAHIFPGTPLENTQDMWSKGRAHLQRPGAAERISRLGVEALALHPERRARGDRHMSRTRPESLARGDRNGSRKYPEKRKRGEAQIQAKLTDDLVREIRASTETGGSIAKRLGISKTVVNRARRGKTWRHVV